MGTDLFAAIFHQRQMQIKRDKLTFNSMDQLVPCQGFFFKIQAIIFRIYLLGPKDNFL
jgi:hypothetical protein